MYKLIVTDCGDPSVGINSVSWEVELPFDFKFDKSKSIEQQDKDDWFILQEFKKSIIGVYNEFCEGRCKAEYNFEYEIED